MRKVNIEAERLWDDLSEALQGIFGGWQKLGSFLVKQVMAVD